MSLLDVTIASAVLAIAITSLMSLIVSSIQLGRVNRETSLAYQAARRVCEEIQADPFDQVFALRNANPADDPGGAGTAPGPAFDVLGLRPRAGDPDGRVGEILFPVVGTELREDLVDAGLGMPRDLDGDGATDAADHAADYSVLPVRVRVSWRGVSGSRQVEVVTMLMEW
jgi:hypothetical protein